MPLPRYTPTQLAEAQKQRLAQLETANEVLRQNVNDLTTRLEAEQRKCVRLNLYYPLRVAERDAAVTALAAMQRSVRYHENLADQWRQNYQRLMDSYLLLSEMVRLTIEPERYHMLRESLLRDLQAGQPITPLPEPVPAGVQLTQPPEVQP